MDKNTIGLALIICLAIFSITILATAFYVASLKCEDLIINSDNSKLCDYNNTLKAENMLAYCANITNPR